MLHVHEFATPPAKRFLTRTPDATLLTPSEYLQLRRKAAGLEIRDLAERLEKLRGHLIRSGDVLPTMFAVKSDIVALILMLESTGARAKLRDTLDAIALVMPFDADVYQQLADAAPQRHPRVCRGCGCSTHDRCRHADTGDCSWESPTQCSHCAQKAEL